MNLNRKGYLTVEVILGATIAFAIAFFLMLITIKMVNVTDDNYRDIGITTDSALVISDVKSLLDNRDISNISCNNNTCDISYSDGSSGYLGIDNNSIIYGSGADYLYVKKLDDSLSNISISSSINGDVTNSNNIYFRVSASNVFVDKNYSFVIPIWVN